MVSAARERGLISIEMRPNDLNDIGPIQPQHPWGIAAQENRSPWLLHAMPLHILNIHANIPCLPCVVPHRKIAAWVTYGARVRWPWMRAADRFLGGLINIVYSSPSWHQFPRPLDRRYINNVSSICTLAKCNIFVDLAWWLQ